MKEEIRIIPTIPHTAIWLLLPVEGIGTLVFLSYVAFHFQTFISQTTALFAWLTWFGSLLCFVGLAYLVVKVLQAAIDAFVALGHGGVDVYQKAIEARNTAAKRALLHAGDNFVVYRQGAEIIVQQIVQERYNYSIRQASEDHSMIEEVGEVESLAAPVQTFRELLEAGVIQSAIDQGKMLLGYSGGVLRFGSWLDLYSCGIGGVSGSGKSTTVRFLLFQAVLAHGQLIMIDPHIGEPEESLAAQFKVFKNIHVMPPCDDDPKAVTKRVQWLFKEYKRRKQLGIKGPVLIFVLDEFNSIVRRLPDELRKELADLLLSIAQEGRKFGLFAMVIGQRWSEQDLGGKNYGAAIRSSLASTLAHRFTDEDQARKLIGGKNGPRCLELEQGHYFFRDTHGSLTEMITPLTVELDGAYIQRHLDGNQAETSYESSQKPASEQYTALPAATTHTLTRNLLESTVKPAGEETHQAALLTRMQQVLKMQADGKQKAEIIKTLWGVSPGGSQAYEQANTEYQLVLRLAYERLGA